MHSFHSALETVLWKVRCPGRDTSSGRDTAVGSYVRKLLGLAAALAVCALLITIAAFPVRAADNVVRIGYQKYGTLILLKAKGLLEKKLEPLGYRVEWTEFTGGPQLLEALDDGVIDYGTTGEAPPIFAQAAGLALVYVGYEPSAPKGEAIVVPADSPLKSVADLKGKTVALNKGSNVHYLLVKALEKARVSYSDVRIAFMPPADARAAFEKRAVDAWVIWDPFLAAAEAETGARQLANGAGIVENHQFYLAARKFDEAHPDLEDVIFASIEEVDKWVKDNAADVAAQFSPALGIPAPILEVAVARQGSGVRHIDDEVLGKQQKIADTFHALGLITKAIRITDAIRNHKP
jgi:sulfonate transport system substrate-binding protein